MADIITASVASQPVYYNDATLPWEQKLALAYEEASLHLKTNLPAGTLIDASKYELAADLAGSQIQTYGATWAPVIEQSQTDPSVNVDPSSPLQMDFEKSRQFYLGQYAQASANLGAYLTGAARSSIVQGVMTQEDFDSGAMVRLRQFSQIIHAGRTGQLKPLVNGETYSAEKSGSVGPIIVSAGQPIVTPSVAGLGADPIFTPTVIITLAIIAAVTIAGIAVGCYYVSQSEKTRRQAFDVCQQAIAKGDPNRDAICVNMADHVATTGSVADKLFPKETQSKIINWAVGGLAIYLVIQFAPEIIKSLSEAKRTYSREREFDERLGQAQVANFARFARRRRSW